MKRPGWPARTLCFVFISVALSHFSIAQTNYEFSASTSTYTDLVGGTEITFANTDDAVSAPINIGFNFDHFGSTCTQVKVSTNGFLMVSISSAWIPDANFIENCYSPVIAPLWDDLAGEFGVASYVTAGSPGSRVFTVEWREWQWQHTAPDAVISFQVKLYEGSNKIEFIYKPEAGSPTDASASIGIVGWNDVHDGYDNMNFYSLSDASATPTLHLRGNNSIDTKPAMNQVYTFTPAPPPLEPTIQAHDIAITDIGMKSATISWASGDGDYRIVLMKQTSSDTEVIDATDGYPRNGNSIFGYEFAGYNWYCLYNGTGSSVQVTGLHSGYDYRIQVLEYNGLGGNQDYLNATAANNPVNFTTVLAAPDGEASDVFQIYSGTDNLGIDTEEHDGNRKAIFMKLGSDLTLPPVVDNTTYDAHPYFGFGEQVGSSGWYCVGNANGFLRLDIFNLKPGQDYLVAIVDYNGEPGFEKYRSDSSINTPVKVRTYRDNNDQFTFTAVSGTYDELTSGIPIDDIEVDEGVSPHIPIGFDFILQGAAFSTCRASSNGIITFNSFMPQNYVPIIDQFGFLNSMLTPLLAPLSDNLDGSGGQASYQTTGVPGSRVFTIEWKNWGWEWWVSDPAISFQIKLYETSNTIEYIYRQEAAAVSSGSASIGLSLLDIGNFRSLSGSGISPTMSSVTYTSTINTKPSTGQIYRFTPGIFSQTISFPEPTAPYHVGDSFELTASATSGLAVSFTTEDNHIITLDGNVATVIGAGTATITASQPGNSFYNAAPQEHITFKIKSMQSIAFIAPGDRTLSDPPFMLEATTTSELPVTFTSLSDNITIGTDNLVTMLSAGPGMIKAEQTGNSEFEAAEPVTHNFCVNPPQPLIQVPNFAGIPVLTSQASEGNQWFRNGVAIVGATAPTLNLSDEGVYSVQVTVNGCSSLMSQEYELIITGVEKSDPVIKVFPNPVKESFIVDLTDLHLREPAEITIIDLSGKELQTWHGQGSIECDIRHYKSGNYVLIIVAGRVISTQQITVQ